MAAGGMLAVIPAICLFILTPVWSLTDSINEMRVQHMGENALRLSCRFTNTENSRIILVSIFEDNLNNTLVTINNGDCPKVEASARAKDIYLQQCVQSEKRHSLDIFLENYNPADSSGFGCNYTYIAEGSIQHSVYFVPLAKNTSLGEVNQTNYTCALPRNHEAKEGTTTATSSTDKKLDSSGCESIHTYLKLISSTSSSTLILMIIYWIAKCKEMRRRSNSHQITVTKKGKKLLDNKTDKLKGSDTHHCRLDSVDQDNPETRVNKSITNTPVLRESYVSLKCD